MIGIAFLSIVAVLYVWGLIDDRKWVAREKKRLKDQQAKEQNFKYKIKP